MKHCVFCVYIQLLHYSKFLEGILNLCLEIHNIQVFNAKIVQKPSINNNIIIIIIIIIIYFFLLHTSYELYKYLNI